MTNEILSMLVEGIQNIKRGKDNHVSLNNRVVHGFVYGIHDHQNVSKNNHLIGLHHDDLIPQPETRSDAVTKA